MIESHSLVRADFDSDWYAHWAKMLKQDTQHLEGYALYANKFWQNAIMAQALWERNVVKPGMKGLGFGVGQERLPALFADYGVDIMATDQDFTTKRAGHWSKYELATSAQSLNKLGICPNAEFNKRVSYQAVDMTKIPASLEGQYDFLWSNCALGHLGSIEAGLSFIEDSLQCLKPGGYAVHTTELNILSNDATVTGGSTVVFRLKDIYKLQSKLIEMGYEVRPFHLTFGSSAWDRRVSFGPQFGNDYSKIQIMGHLATQIVLIIRRPMKKSSTQSKLQRQLICRNTYSQNKRRMQTYRLRDRLISSVLQSQKAPVSSIKLVPIEREVRLTIRQGKSKTVRVSYSNNSKLPLFTTFDRLADSYLLVLATYGPNDRKSKFKASNWGSANRTGSKLLVADITGRFASGEYLRPMQDCAFDVVFDATKVSKGTYSESFCLVQEHRGWVNDSAVNITITVN